MSGAVPVNTRRRDWFRILRDLAAAGVSYAHVGRKCCRDVGTVCGWANGGDPKEADARVVLALYAKHCPALYAEHQREFDIRCDFQWISAGPATGGMSAVAAVANCVAQMAGWERARRKRVARVDDEVSPQLQLELV